MTEGDHILQGVYTGTTPGEAANDPLDIIAQLADHTATAVVEEMSGNYQAADERYPILDRARTILMLNARHVPILVDEVLEKALSQGGFKP